MKLEIEAKNLNECLRMAIQAINKNCPFPILQNAYIEAFNNKIEIVCSDYETEIKVIADCIKVKEQGKCCIPAKEFLQIVSNFTGKVKIAVNSETQVVSISSGKSRYKLNGLLTEEFTFLPYTIANFSLLLPSTAVANVFPQLLVAVAKNDLNPVFTGVLMSIRNEFANFLSTDKHQMVWWQYQYSEDGTQNKNEAQNEFYDVIIPGQFIQELVNLASAEEEFFLVDFSNEQIEFTSKKFSIKGRLLVGSFPKTDAVISTTKNYLNNFSFRKDDCLEALKRLSTVAKNDYSRIQLKTKENLVISAKADCIGEAEEIVQLQESEGELHSFYRLDQIYPILSSFKNSEIISIYFDGARQPIVFWGGNDDHGIAILLPITGYGHKA